MWNGTHTSPDGVPLGIEATSSVAWNVSNSSSGSKVLTPHSAICSYLVSGYLASQVMIPNLEPLPASPVPLCSGQTIGDTRHVERSGPGMGDHGLVVRVQLEPDFRSSRDGGRRVRGSGIGVAYDIGGSHIHQGSWEPWDTDSSVDGCIIHSQREEYVWRGKVSVGLLKVIR